MKRVKDKDQLMPPPIVQATIPGLKVNKLAEDNIYADIGSYNLSTSKDSKSSVTARDRQRAATTDSKRQYFDDKKDQKDSQLDPSKEKSAAVLEAERTLGAYYIYK